MAPNDRPVVTRKDLEDEYDRLMREMVKVGMQPVISDAIVPILTDGELRALVKDSVWRLVRFRRLESEL